MSDKKDYLKGLEAVNKAMKNISNSIPNLSNFKIDTPTTYPSMDYSSIISHLDTDLPEDYKSPGDWLEEITINQNEQITELKKANEELLNSNKILSEQNEELRNQAVENANEMKKQKIWNWLTFGVSTLIAVVGVVVAIVLR